jgi:hypothetical protein
MMRRRSFHSRVITKGNSNDTSGADASDRGQEKPVTKVKKLAKRVGVTTVARKLLDPNKKVDQKYYKIMDIMTDPNFLIACYEEIKSVPGNMTRGTDAQTLDGISYD